MNRVSILDCLSVQDISPKCIDCPSLAAWIVKSEEILGVSENANPEAVAAEIIYLAQRCALPSEGDNCFSGDDMFMSIIESDIKTAAITAKEV